MKLPVVHHLHDQLRMRAFLLLVLLTGAHTFHILRKDKSKNHQDITRSAILQAAAKACEKITTYIEPVELNSQTLAKACRPGTEENFENAIRIISYHNVITDLKHPKSAKHHFDNEEFTAGKELITTGINDIIQSVKKQDFDTARKRLGEILHTLQDFYSHSNWIELGKTEPCSALINKEENIPNIARKDEKTCEEHCANEHCGVKILPDIINNHILTSGYFGINKQKGKCSHGGPIDFPTGIGRSWDGINKDQWSSDSSHGALHEKAADVAAAASVKLLENIWERTDGKSVNDFLRLMGLHKTKPKGEWKTKIPFLKFKSRYPEELYVEV